jgi:hypothetical protein
MVGVALIVAVFAASRASAHDLERTQVLLTFARDGSFVLDVANDPSWLKLRMEAFAARAPEPALQAKGAVFIDRVVLFVDGHEVRPTSAEYLGGETLATYRLRGRMPLDAHTLRWYYGLVIDPYPLTIRRADGRVQVEEIGGDAWSRTIDLSGQFQAPRMLDTLAPIGIIGLLLLPIVLRLGGRRVNTKATKDTKKETFGPLPLCP